MNKRVFFINRVGPGPWSDSLDVLSGAGAPDCPISPHVQFKSPTTAFLEWDEPSFNGAVVTEYRLQLAIVSSLRCLSPPPVTFSQSSSFTSSSVADLEGE